MSVRSKHIIESLGKTVLNQCMTAYLSGLAKTVFEMYRNGVYDLSLRTLPSQHGRDGGHYLRPLLTKPSMGKVTCCRMLRRCS
jgi:hypothetical protein